MVTSSADDWLGGDFLHIKGFLNKLESLIMKKSREGYGVVKKFVGEMFYAEH